MVATHPCIEPTVAEVDFLMMGEARGYQTRTPAKLFGDDASLLFTNASIIPFKQDLLQKTLRQPAQVLQTCFRTNAPEHMFSLFDMYGMIAPIEKAESLCLDVQEMLACVLGDANQIRVYSRDADLTRLWNGVSSSVDKTEKTHWQYGEGERLTGRGGNIWAVCQSSIPAIPPEAYPVGSLMLRLHWVWILSGQRLKAVPLPICQSMNR
jgi:hypothetical protein